jgi:hypothetical protein
MQKRAEFLATLRLFLVALRCGNGRFVGLLYAILMFSLRSHSFAHASGSTLAHSERPAFENLFCSSVTIFLNVRVWLLDVDQSIPKAVLCNSGLRDPPKPEGTS